MEGSWLYITRQGVEDIAHRQFRVDFGVDKFKHDLTLGEEFVGDERPVTRHYYQTKYDIRIHARKVGDTVYWYASGTGKLIEWR